MQYDQRMTLISLLFALLIEQLRPLKEDNWLERMMVRWSHWVKDQLDAGQNHHALLVWSACVMVPALFAFGMYWLLWSTLGWVVSGLWSIAVLYSTLGFRQFSHHFTQIKESLEAGEEDKARSELCAWQKADTAQLPKRELIRLSIEYSVLAAHQHVFGVLFWFSLGAAFGLGPAAAVIYRMSHLMARVFKEDANHPLGETLDQESAASSQAHWVSETLEHVAKTTWGRIDWTSSRVTALSFAIVGNFEDAIESWRTHASEFPHDNDGVVLAATAGALNLRLGGLALASLHQNAMDDSPDMGLKGGQSTAGKEAETEHLRSVVGLVWRTVVMWFVLLSLLTMARLLG
jgi:adenosylcobinamide-phosphate synthase